MRGYVLSLWVLIAGCAGLPLPQTWNEVEIRCQQETIQGVWSGDTIGVLGAMAETALQPARYAACLKRYEEATGIQGPISVPLSPAPAVRSVPDGDPGPLAIGGDHSRRF